MKTLTWLAAIAALGIVGLTGCRSYQGGNAADYNYSFGNDSGTWQPNNSRMDSPGTYVPDPAVDNF